MCSLTPNLKLLRSLSQIIVIGATHPVILVSRHRHELALREDEGLEVLRSAGVLAPGVNVDHVQARLVAVHRIQYHLRIQSLSLMKTDNKIQLTWPFSSN